MSEWIHFRDDTRTSKKQRVCELCLGLILIGQKHLARTGKAGGEVSTWRMHLHCWARTKNWTNDDWEYLDPFAFAQEMIRENLLTKLAQASWPALSLFCGAFQGERQWRSKIPSFDSDDLQELQKLLEKNIT